MNATVNNINLSTLRSHVYPTGEFYAVPNAVNFITKVEMNGCLYEGTIRYLEMQIENLFQEMSGQIIDIRLIGNNIEYPVLIGSNGNVYATAWAIKDLVQLPLGAVVDLDADAIPFDEIGGSWYRMLKATVIERREGEIRLQIDEVEPAPIGEDAGVVINSSVMIFTHVPC